MTDVYKIFSPVCKKNKKTRLLKVGKQETCKQPVLYPSCFQRSDVLLCNYWWFPVCQDSPVHMTQKTFLDCISSACCSCYIRDDDDQLEKGSQQTRERRQGGELSKHPRIVYARRDGIVLEMTVLGGSTHTLPVIRNTYPWMSQITGTPSQCSHYQQHLCSLSFSNICVKVPLSLLTLSVYGIFWTKKKILSLWCLSPTTLSPSPPPQPQNLLSWYYGVKHFVTFHIGFDMSEDMRSDMSKTCVMTRGVVAAAKNGAVGGLQCFTPKASDIYFRNSWYPPTTEWKKSNFGPAHSSSAFHSHLLSLSHTHRHVRCLSGKPSNTDFSIQKTSPL